MGQQAAHLLHTHSRHRSKESSSMYGKQGREGAKEEEGDSPGPVVWHPGKTAAHSQKS